MLRKLLEMMVEEVDDSCHGVAKASTRNGLLYIKSLEVSPEESDTAIVEDALWHVIEGLRVDFEVDFNLEYVKGNVMVLSVLQY